MTNVSFLYAFKYDKNKVYCFSHAGFYYALIFALLYPIEENVFYIDFLENSQFSNYLLALTVSSI